MSAPSVMELLQYRQSGQHIAEADTPPYKLGLAVEGGTMRGIITHGMLLALRDLRLLPLFDVYTGTSAGAINMAYTLADQGAMPIDMYVEGLRMRENVNARRLFSSGKPIVDTRNIHQLSNQYRRLRVEALRQRFNDTLFIGVSNMTRRRGELISPAKAGDSFVDYIWAGATAPFVSGKPWRIADGDYYDGHIFYPDPLLGAVELGCTHVLVLSSMRRNSA